MDPLRWSRNLKVHNRDTLVKTFRNLKRIHYRRKLSGLRQKDCYFLQYLDRLHQQQTKEEDRECKVQHPMMTMAYQTQYHYVEKIELPTYLLLLHTHKICNFLEQMCKNIFLKEQAVCHSHSGQVWYPLLQYEHYHSGDSIWSHELRAQFPRCSEFVRCKLQAQGGRPEFLRDPI